MTPLDTLKALRLTYPTPMRNEQLGQLLNAVAWTHRDGGYGLLKKPSGANCQQPQTGILISRDILGWRDGSIFDCLIDAEGKAEPTWGRKNPVDPSRWTPPVDASVSLPPPVVTPPPGTSVPYPGDAFGTEIGARLFADYADAGQSPNAGMGVWFLRTLWDMAHPPYLTPHQSLDKHQAEWRALLGL